MAYSVFDYGRRNICLPKSDIYLNARDGKGRHISFPIGDNIQNGNTLIVGTTRTGKTVFIRNMAARLRVTYPDALFLFMDVKQDYISDQRLYRTGDYAVSYNEMKGGYKQFQWSIIEEALLSRNPYSEIKEIVEILFESLPGQGDNQIFVESAKLAFGAFLNVFVYRFKNNIDVSLHRHVPCNAEVIDVYNRMSFEDLRKWIKAMKSQSRLCDEVLPADNNGRPSKYAQSVLSIIRVFTEMFDGNFCGTKKNSIRAFLDTYGTAMFLEFDYGKQRSSAAFFRLFVKKIIQEKMALESPYKNKKIYMFLDESSVLRGDADLVNALNIGAGDGIRIILACQSTDHLYMQAPNQLNEHYGQSMLAGFSNVICFRPSDGNTVNTIQEKFGKADIERMVMPVDRYQPAIVSVTNDYIVSSQQLTSLGLGHAYVKLKSETPIRIYFEEG